MSYKPDQHHRRSIRWAGYDYTQGGAYFVTICVARRVRRNNVFGRIENGVMRLNDYGAIVANEWERTATLRPGIVLDEWIVMPNHFHAIVMLDSVGTHGNAPNIVTTPRIEPNNTEIIGSQERAHCHAPLRAARSLSSLVSGFKGSVSRRINAHRAAKNLAPVAVWQRNFYERVIRDEKELDDTRRYIGENPLNWPADAENPLANPPDL